MGTPASRIAAQINAEAKAARRKPPRAGPRVRREHPRAGSRYELELLRFLQCEKDVPAPVLQHRFAKDLGRQYRLDFAWPDRMLAAEVDGGRWLVRRGKGGRPVPVGRHCHVEDYRKANLAQRLGWHVLRFTPEMVRSGEAASEIRMFLCGSSP